ncbi:unnamed protein product [Porites lobata]|uniref:Uncharacterized protein n=1 Tax=Porites lobata TaxID=104759 RepID=A0ABN8NML4_9CNID|nr:unnamed protein product [Porites lobata]
MEVTTQLIQRSTYQKTYFFFKTVQCSQVPDVNKEIDSLIKGVFGQQIIGKVKNEITVRNLGNLRDCKTGLEVHLKEVQGRRSSRNVRTARRHWWCSKTKVSINN